MMSSGISDRKEGTSSAGVTIASWTRVGAGESAQLYTYTLMRYVWTDGPTYKHRLLKNPKSTTTKRGRRGNKAGYTATPVACGWAGAVVEVTRSFGQERLGQKSQKHKK